MKHAASQRGMALVLCTVFTAATLVLLSTLSMRLVAQAKHADVAEESVQVLAAAENALALALADVASGGTGTLGFTRSPEQVSALPGAPLSFDAPEVSALPASGNPSVRIFTVARLIHVGTQPLTLIQACAAGPRVTRAIEAVYRREENSAAPLKLVSWRELPPPLQQSLQQGVPHAEL